jgi:hypothetical protein
VPKATASTTEPTKGELAPKGKGSSSAVATRRRSIRAEWSRRGSKIRRWAMDEDEEEDEVEKGKDDE